VLGSKSISDSRALLVLDDEGAILPDLHRRILRDYQIKKNTHWMIGQTYPVLILFFVAGFIMVMVSGQQHNKISYDPLAIAGLVSFMGSLCGAMLLYMYHKTTVKTLKLPCPYCEYPLDLLDEWICGNCRKVNNDSMKEFAIPLDQCVEELCSEPKPTAYACPHCENIIKLDKVGFAEKRSDQPPHKGIAEYRNAAAQIHFMNQLIEESSQKKEDKQFFDD